MIRLLKGDLADRAAFIPVRTRRRWTSAYRDAESDLGSGYLGLLPQPRRGNSKPKLPDESHALDG